MRPIHERRGFMALAMWEGKVPRDAFRTYLSSVWNHDHRHVIHAAGTRRRLAYMFRYVAFPLPGDLPDVVRVWRGTSHLTLADAQKGYSWTTDRDIACWFAMRFGVYNGSALVLVADVPKNQISLLHDGRSEHEAVLMKPPAEATIDGHAEEWALGYERQSAIIIEANRSSHKSIIAA
ncbi:MAG: hypothetical protein V5B32_13345 [Candidatus Accumulibacter sp. UW26]|jgi:hypothetical protein